MAAARDSVPRRPAQHDLYDAYHTNATPAERAPLRAKVDQLTAANEAGNPARAIIDAGTKAPVGLGRGTPADQSLPESRFVVESDTGRASFRASLERASASHPAGAAVEVKDASFYTDPNAKLFLAPDKSAGAAVSPDGDLVSVFNCNEVPCSCPR